MKTYTVRPRGHPFDRRLALAPELIEEWRSLRDAHFVIADEGPGLSGSSFISVARALVENGIPEHRVVLLPSHEADAGRFVSEAARETWGRHAKYVAIGPDPEGRDLSAGAWRNSLYADVRCFPAVHPQHERRKFLHGRRLAKFAGYGRYGRKHYERAIALWKAGYTPQPLELREGYLESEFIDGCPLTAASAGDGLVRHICLYVQTVADLFPSRRPVPIEEIREMAAINVAESIGERERDATIGALDRLAPAAAAGRTAEIDGRMLPHEWLATAGGLIKTDALDHYDDHFFPGCQDPAWDLAGAAVEFALTTDLFTNIQPIDKLRYYVIAYLTYRLGYCNMACGDVGKLSEAQRFKQCASNYRMRLLREIEDGC